MTKVDLLNRLLSKMIYNESTSLEYLADDILKICEQKLGTKNMANMITIHPSAGYFVRYVDNFAPKLMNEVHQKNVEKTEQEIIEILKS